MTDDPAHEILVADADRRARRWYWVLQAWTLSLIPAAWLLQEYCWAAFPVWLVGCQVLSLIWRKAARHALALREARLQQLIGEAWELSRMI